MKPVISFLLLALLLVSCSLSTSTRSGPDPFSELLSSNGKSINNPSNNKGSGSTGNNNNNNNGGDIGGMFGPGNGFNIPGFGKDWGHLGGGYGVGYGSPSGGYSRGGVIRPTVVCKEKGPCYNKKLTCPAKCFTSYSRSGKGYGAGGGGGGCTMDCKKKCVAYC
ncbi:hypothetical protein K2173_001570 [Erythroxylum novogranatense]|uniref:Glycine-rich protein n=1 Tax=Erythroxylum novogranatense TaxID=1862640 RepID=A0AAV8T564_9ROSI|nr:hypothetical protein K2173_001570 [Erythroxylum novogranatense]